MWILIRLVLAAIGFGVRQFARGRNPATTSMFADAPYFVRVHRSKKRITGFTIGMERKTPTWIRMHAESAADRAFKAAGIANEIQTGDPEFDKKVYVTCDHPHVATVLTETSALRQAVVKMLDDGYRRISFDGAAVTAVRRSRVGPTDGDLAMLKNVRDASARLSAAPPGRTGDRFLWKALIVEGVIWSIAGYAIGSFLDGMFNREDVHLSYTQLWPIALSVALVAFLSLLLVIVLWLRGSSRGHRVIIESAIVLLLSLPVASSQAVADTNRALDTTTTVVERTYTQCQTRRHRSRRSTRYSYHLHLNGNDDGPGLAIPTEIEVVRSLCTAATTLGPGPVSFAIGSGRWGIPWYRSIRIGNTTWEAG